MSDFYMFVASCLLCVAGFVTFTLYDVRDEACEDFEERGDNNDTE